MRTYDSNLEIWWEEWNLRGQYGTDLPVDRQGFAREHSMQVVAEQQGRCDRFPDGNGPRNLRPGSIERWKTAR